MARSPLFRTLKRLARRALTTGATPPPRREGPSRRDVLRNLGAAAALMPLAAACGDGNHGSDVTQVAIIGGGIAGMTCAHFLALAGVKASIFEASMRIGGRTFTARGMLQGDQICELGGELIDTDHFVMPILAEAYGLTLDDLEAATAGLEQNRFVFGGSVLLEADIVTAFTPVAAKISSALTATDADDTEFDRIDNLSIPQWLEQEAGLPATSLIRQLLEVSYLEEFGLEVDQQSAFNLLTLIDSDTPPDPFAVFGDSDEKFHLHEGSDSIATAIAAELADQILFDHALTKVTATSTGFELTFSTAAGDEVVQVAHVIYALPFTKLREVDLDGAGLTDDKRMVIDTLGYGTNAKLMLQFTDRPWETHLTASGGCITDVGELQTTWATSRAQTGAQGVITNFVGGDRGIAIAMGTPESQAQMVLPWLDTVFPGTSPTYIAGSAIRQHWPTAPFAKGSYASYLVGQWSFLGKEGAREGNQHFCGEHCSENFQGYMEGGAETGAMVAGEVLDDLMIAQPAALAAIITQLTAQPRGSYHAGFGKRMSIRQVKRGVRRG